MSISRIVSCTLTSLSPSLSLVRTSLSRQCCGQCLSSLSIANHAVGFLRTTSFQIWYPLDWLSKSNFCMRRLWNVAPITLSCSDVDNLFFANSKLFTRTQDVDKTIDMSTCGSSNSSRMGIHSNKIRLGVSRYMPRLGLQYTESSCITPS